MGEKQTGNAAELSAVKKLSTVVLVSSIVFGVLALLLRGGVYLSSIVGGMWGGLTIEETRRLSFELMVRRLYWQIPCMVVILTISVVCLVIANRRRRAMRRAQMLNPFSDDRFIRIRLIERAGSCIRGCIAAIVICTLSLIWVVPIM